MLSDGRLVYISPELHTAFVELSEIKRLGFAAAHATRALLAAWDAAPSNPAEAILPACRGMEVVRMGDGHNSIREREPEDIRDAVLAALGVSSPHAAPTGDSDA